MNNKVRKVKSKKLKLKLKNTLLNTINNLKKNISKNNSKTRYYLQKLKNIKRVNTYLIENYGRILVHTDTDGNCQYRAITQGLNQQLKRENLPLMTYRELLNYVSQFYKNAITKKQKNSNQVNVMNALAFLDDQEKIEINRIILDEWSSRSPQCGGPTWGSETTALIISLYLKRPIIIIEFEGFNSIQPFKYNMESSGDPIIIARFMDHYYGTKSILSDTSISNTNLRRGIESIQGIDNGFIRNEINKIRKITHKRKNPRTRNNRKSKKGNKNKNKNKNNGFVMVSKNNIPKGI